MVKCNKCKKKIKKGLEKYQNAKVWCGRCFISNRRRAGIERQKKGDANRKLNFIERMLQIQNETKRI